MEILSLGYVSLLWPHRHTITGHYLPHSTDLNPYSCLLFHKIMFKLKGCCVDITEDQTRILSWGGKSRVSSIKYRLLEKYGKEEKINRIMYLVNFLLMNLKICTYENQIRF